MRGPEKFKIPAPANDHSESELPKVENADDESAENSNVIQLPVAFKNPPPPEPANYNSSPAFEAQKRKEELMAAFLAKCDELVRTGVPEKVITELFPYVERGSKPNVPENSVDMHAYAVLKTLLWALEDPVKNERVIDWNMQMMRILPYDRSEIAE